MSALAAIAAASLLVGAPWLVSTWRRVGAYAYPYGGFRFELILRTSRGWPSDRRLFTTVGSSA